jgi:hypothetical protein
MALRGPCRFRRMPVVRAAVATSAHSSSHPAASSGGVIRRIWRRHLAHVISPTCMRVSVPEETVNLADDFGRSSAGVTFFFSGTHLMFTPSGCREAADGAGTRQGDEN